MELSCLLRMTDLSPHTCDVASSAYSKIPNHFRLATTLPVERHHSRSIPHIQGGNMASAEHTDGCSSSHLEDFTSAASLVKRHPGIPFHLYLPQVLRYSSRSTYLINFLSTNIHSAVGSPAALSVREGMGFNPIAFRGLARTGLRTRVCGPLLKRRWALPCAFEGTDK